METRNLALHLKDINQLFDDPETNPLKSSGPYEKGMDTLLDELDDDRGTEPVKLTIYLPASQVQNDLEEQVKDALRRYCSYRIQENETEIRQIRLRGKRQLIFAMPFMAVALIFSALAYLVASGASNVWVQVIAGVFATLFSVASWIFVWGPIDTLSYEWRPYLFENHQYARLLAAEVQILAE